MKVYLFTLLLCCLVNNMHLSAQTYTIRKIQTGLIHIKDKGDDNVWSKADLLTHFIYPWENETAPATSFRALWDGKWLYCRYEVKDDSVTVLVKKNEKLETGASDRVEIFFNINDTMKPYYCLELDANGRVLDYEASYYRKMNYHWQWPKQELIVNSSRTKDGYVVDIAISIQSLKNLGLLQNNQLHAGLFRAECKGFINGRANLKWISWIKPSSTEPDFHIPSAFGTLLLE